MAKVAEPMTEERYAKESGALKEKIVAAKEKLRNAKDEKGSEAVQKEIESIRAELTALQDEYVEACGGSEAHCAPPVKAASASAE